MPDNIHLTVAVVIESKNRYLMVRELCTGAMRYNQPAGHVEPGETPIEAAIREAHEETGWHIEPTSIISFSTYKSASNGVTYYRLAFAATAIRFDESAEIDSDIDEAVWLSYEEILGLEDQLRSPLVLEALDDFRSGQCYSLDLMKAHR